MEPPDSDPANPSRRRIDAGRANYSRPEPKSSLTIADNASGITRRSEPVNYRWKKRPFLRTKSRMSPTSPLASSRVR